MGGEKPKKYLNNLTPPSHDKVFKKIHGERVGGVAVAQSSSLDTSVQSMSNAGTKLSRKEEIDIHPRKEKKEDAEKEESTVVGTDVSTCTYLLTCLLAFFLSFFLTP